MHPPRPVKREEEDVVVVEVKEHIQAEETSSWVGRQVDALFSPVLSFLASGESVSAKEQDKEVQDDGDDNHVVTDEDVAMDSMETTTEDELQQQLAVRETWSYAEEELHHSHSHHTMGDLEESQPSSSSFDDEEFNPYLFIKSLPRYDLVCGKPRICLPPKADGAPPITLVLDLDETLVHCTVDPTPDANLVFPVMFHGMEYQVHVRLRPYLFEFLERVHDQYEVVIFTASQQVYADELLNLIDPGKKKPCCCVFIVSLLSHAHIL
jgi:TFIIF-interacting CTD phosphatase-like protein